LSSILRALNKVENESAGQGQDLKGFRWSRPAGAETSAFKKKRLAGGLKFIFCTALLVVAGLLYFQGPHHPVRYLASLLFAPAAEKKNLPAADIPVSKPGVETVPDARLFSPNDGNPPPIDPAKLRGKMFEKGHRKDPAAATAGELRAPPPRIARKNEGPPSGLLNSRSGVKTASAGAKLQRIKTPGSPPLKKDPAGVGGNRTAAIPLIKEAGGLKLHAIAWSPEPDKRMAVVNELIVREGASFDEFSVVRIDPNEIVIQKDREQWRLILRRR